MSDLTSADSLHTVCEALDLDEQAYCEAFRNGAYSLGEVHGMPLGTWVYQRLGRYWMPRGASFWDAVAMAMPHDGGVDDLRAAYRQVRCAELVGRL
jgi:hypothetical protein